MKPLKLLTSKTSTEQNSKKHRKSQFHSMEKTFIVLHLSHFYLLLRWKHKKSDYKKILLSIFATSQDRRLREFGN